MVWIGVNFSGLTRVFILSQKTTFDSDFYVEKVLPIVKRDGIKLVEDNFIFQQDGAKTYTRTINGSNRKTRFFSNFT